MIVLENITKIYQTRRAPVTALDGLCLEINDGEFVAVRGPSGSGKTTLLMTIAAMLRPSRGHVLIDGHKLYQMSVGNRARFRAREIGFVFQMFHLIPYLTVIDNVLLAAGVTADKNPTARAMELLNVLGLRDRAQHKPSALSAGEKQRTAIARALLNNPTLLLADEPTGNLDPANADVVLNHLSAFHQHGGTVILATHSRRAEQLVDRTVHLQNGVIGNSAECSPSN